MLDLQITDKFLYHEGKAYTLDPRFNALKDKQIDVLTDDGLSISTTVESNVDKLLISKALEEEGDLHNYKPKIGNEPFEVRHGIFDIEVIVDKREDLKNHIGKIVCIVIWDSYTNVYHKLRLGNIEGESERIFIQKILEKFKELDFDIISGWNVKFDMGWLISKAQDYDLDLSIYFPGGKTFISQYTDFEGKFKESFYIGGRVLLDGMDLYIKKTATTEKLSSYNLKSVAAVEKLPEWEDLGSRVKELWDKDPLKVLDYCRLDVERTMQIIKKKDLLGGALTTCKFFGCGFDDVTTNSKVIDCLTFLLKRNRVLPNIVRGREKAKIIGAKVLETKAGVHKNVGIFDAASLYPSIIQGLNISPECLVKDQALYEDHKTDCIIVSVGESKRYLFKKYYKMGLMTEVITEMRKLREQIRSNRAQATKDDDTEKFALHNNEEKVAKGVLASVYGVMGFSGFRLFNEDCANIITKAARDVILLIVDNLESSKFHVIAGDSVLGDTPVICEIEGIRKIIPIKSLIAKSHRDRESGRQTHKTLKILSDNMFRFVEYSYVHKVNKGKKGFRICTRKSYIEVTEDHSLIINGNIVKPTELKIGDSIDTIDNLKIFRSDVEFSEDMAWLFGFFIAEGTLGKYAETSQWKIGNNFKHFLIKSKNILKKHLGINTTLNYYDCNGEFGELKPASGSTQLLIDYFMYHCYSENEKIVPEIILNSTKKVKEKFFEGIMDGDGNYDNKDNHMSIGQIHKSVLAGLIYILEELGYDYSLNLIKDKKNFIKINVLNRENPGFVSPSNVIKSIEKFDIDELVYDLSTFNEQFRAGIGNVLVHNTDSVFIQMNNVNDGFDAVDKINEMTDNYMKEMGVDDAVVKINYEKFFKWVMFNKKVAPKLKTKLYRRDVGSAKKKYIGFISHVESGPREMKEVNELYYKGFELRRSDSAKVLKDVMRKFFNLMEDGDYHKSISYLKKIKDEFHTYNIDYISMPRSVNVEEAKGPWADGYRYAKIELKFEFEPETMPKLIYVKNQFKYPKTKVICYQDSHIIPDEFKIDYDIMFDKIIKAKFEPILESLDIYWDVAINNQVALDQWC